MLDFLSAMLARSWDVDHTRTLCPTSMPSYVLCVLVVLLQAAPRPQCPCGALVGRPMPSISWCSCRPPHALALLL
eukprot:scaffold82420_cov19-Tisochrysis_lutea.AAC.4